MTPNGPVAGTRTVIQGKGHRLPDFEIIWAGESGWDDGLCLGSEDGRIRFTGSLPDFDVKSGEPINGVAFTDDMMAVSTPAEVVLWKRPSPSGETARAIYSGGAHDVIATASGNFSAPLGPNGLLGTEKDASGNASFYNFRIKSRDFIFYKTACVGTYDGHDVLICALRRGGWARFFVGLKELDVAPDSDIVDVCRLQSERFPRAAIALARDKSLRIIEDVAGSKGVKTLRLDDLRGTAYEVFSSGRQVFLLTSESLYSLGDLVHRCLDGEQVAKPTGIRKADMEAVSASIAHGRSLLIVLPDGGVTEFALNDLAPASGAGDSITFTPSMTFDDSPLTRYEMALA